MAPRPGRAPAEPRGATCLLNFPFRSDEQDQLCLQRRSPGLTAGSPATNSRAQTWVSAATPPLEWPPPPGGPGTHLRQSPGQSSVSAGMEETPWTPKDPESWVWTPGQALRPRRASSRPGRVRSVVSESQPSAPASPRAETRSVSPKRLCAGSRALALQGSWQP